MGLDIAFVVHYFDRSEGTGGYTVELVTRFARDHRVTVYAAGVRAPVPDGVRVVIVPALRGRAYATILTFPMAFSAVRGWHDVVHAQGWVATRADVVTAHIVLAAWRERARAAGVRSPVGERWLGGFVSGREAALYRRNAGAVIAPSRQVKADLARLYGRNDGVHVVPHGFTNASTIPRAQARAQLKLPFEGYIALYVGDARKGLNTGLEAVAATAGVHLLVLSGSPAGAYYATMQRLGIADRVHWCGHLADPSPAYAAADLLVHPTIYDTFGLVIAEAMSHGLPVVVSRAAGGSELLSHGESAWVLETGSAAETAAGIQALVGDPALRERLGRTAREVARRRSWDDVAEETLAVYDTVARK